MDLVTTAMSILANTRPLTFFGKYSAHLDYRGWKGEMEVEVEGQEESQEGGPGGREGQEEGPGGRGKRKGPGGRGQEDSPSSAHLRHWCLISLARIFNGSGAVQ